MTILTGESALAPLSTIRLAFASWRGQSVNRRIFAAMVTIGSLTAIVKVASTLKEMAIAREFGAGDGLDAFLIAYLVPSFAINVVAGSFNAALIPTFIQVRVREGREAAQELYSSVMVCSITLLVLLSILIAAASPRLLPILASGFAPEKLALTQKLFFILLPLIPLSGLFATWAAILNASERFALAAIAPIMTPFAVIGMVLLLGGEWGIYSYAIAIIAGTIIEGALLARALSRQNISIVPRWNGLNRQTRQVMKQYAPMIAAGLLMNSTVVVDQAMAATLGAGSVSALSYGNKVVAMMLGIGSLALSTAILPQFSRIVSEGDWRSLRHTLKTYARLSFIVTVPLTLAFMLLSHLIVRVLFERGAFTANDTATISSVQVFYLLQVPFYVAGLLFVRLISALKANSILMWGTFISAVTNITLDYLLMKWLGVSGIALSTSIVYMVSFAFLSLMAMRALRSAELELGEAASRCG
ncbi:MAG TPA: murein biosynthesis integral membrane protein MurJ [Blastocatellia bacterium]|nr:murein biosynthesis integral membrane protein MurJ [Blastocatellia bacterium]